jgi:hypothetical protein
MGDMFDAPTEGELFDGASAFQTACCPMEE